MFPYPHSSQARGFLPCGSTARGSGSTAPAEVPPSTLVPHVCLVVAGAVVVPRACTVVPRDLAVVPLGSKRKYHMAPR